MVSSSNIDDTLSWLLLGPCRSEAGIRVECHCALVKGHGHLRRAHSSTVVGHRHAWNAHGRHVTTWQRHLRHVAELSVVVVLLLLLRFGNIFALCVVVVVVGALVVSHLWLKALPTSVPCLLLMHWPHRLWSPHAKVLLGHHVLLRSEWRGGSSAWHERVRSRFKGCRHERRNLSVHGRSLGVFASRLASTKITVG